MIEDTLTERTIPPRPRDPIRGALWDMTYGLGAKTDPLLKPGASFEVIANELETIKQTGKAMVSLSPEIKKLNDNVEKLNVILEKLTGLIKKEE